MFERLIRFAIAQRWLVLLAVLGMAALGLYSYTRLPIDAVPDITNVQVQINTAAPGYSPLETEQRITYPVETVMAGLPGLDYTRSISRYGLSQVTVVFKDGTDLYFARQQVAERVQQVASQIPEGLDPELGPIATGMGEIFMYTVDADPEAVRRWYIERFITLRDTAFTQPDAYFHRYADLSDEEAVAVASGIWARINEVNLFENILPTRERASLILRKAPDHSIERVRLRR